MNLLYVIVKLCKRFQDNDKLIEDTYLKNYLPNIFYIHCVIHRQQLVTKKLGGRLHGSLHIVINRDRIFRQLYEENAEDFEQLLLDIEVRWLSKDNKLKRLVVLWNTITYFMKDTKSAEELIKVYMQQTITREKF